MDHIQTKLSYKQYYFELEYNEFKINLSYIINPKQEGRFLWNFNATCHMLVLKYL